MGRGMDVDRGKLNSGFSRRGVAIQRDLLVLLGMLLVAALFVRFFDTGSLAQWVALHKDTKIDEVIVAAFVLAIGMTVFSIRRSIELTNQMNEYKRLHEEMKKISRESALLGELSDLLQSCLSPEEAHRLIVEHSQLLFPGSSGAVCVTASSRDMVEAVARWGEPALAERHFAPGDCWALRRGRIHCLSHENPSLNCAHLGQARPGYAVCVPMMAHGEALGVLYIDSGPKENTDGGIPSKEQLDSQMRLARIFAEHVALALANLNLREVLRAQSIRDPLTGLFNRRYMEESLERELRRAIRRKSPLGILMIDVDHFKRFNDSFGHEAGDALLKELARILKGHFRGEDIVCRYGGEEFTVILPDADLISTQERAEKLRETAKSLIAQYRGQALDRVTLSVGVSAYPVKGSSSELLLRAADAALYRAKEEGRDRVEVA